MAEASSTRLTTNRNLTVADYAITLAPWAAYIIGTHAIGSWEYGFIIGSFCAAAIVVKEIVTRQSRFMDLGTLVFCLLMTTFAVVDFNSTMNAYLKTYNLPISLAFIGLLASLSIVIGSPFTYRCHRDHLPHSVLHNPETNSLILSNHVSATAVWATSELVAGAISALLILNRHASYAVVVQLIGTLIPIGFTQRTHHKIHTHPTVSPHLVGASGA